jgi:hypothetical protein
VIFLQPLEFIGITGNEVFLTYMNGKCQIILQPFAGVWGLQYRGMTA